MARIIDKNGKVLFRDADYTWLDTYIFLGLDGNLNYRIPTKIMTAGELGWHKHNFIWLE